MGAWMWGIARKQAALWLRRRGHPDVTPELAGAEDPVSAATRKVDLQGALEAVGPAGSEQRELVRLVFIEDRPIRDVATACAEVALMESGRIVFRGTPAKLTERGAGHGLGDTPIERGYSAVLAGARS